MLAVIATASVTVRWNAAAQAPAIARGTVVAVDGNRITLRLQDGTLHAYTAAPQEAAALRKLIGHAIAFRAHR